MYFNFDYTVMVARACNMQAFICCFHDIRGFLHTAWKRTIICLLVANEAKESDSLFVRKLFLHLLKK